MNFLGLTDEQARYETAAAVIVPCPFEKTTSYRKGTAQGPRAILEASGQVEFYDAELKKEPWRPGIHTMAPPALSEAAEALSRIEKTVAKILADNKFPICLGGEHTISAGAIAAAGKQFSDLSVLQIDAHADLRESYEGTPYNHACAMRLALPHIRKIAAVGIRSLDATEAAFAKEKADVALFLDHERRGKKGWIEDVLGRLTDTVYLTVDVDGFDPSLFGATGTPEPGGLSWYEGLDLIRKCFLKKRVVGADVVELLPQSGFHACTFAAAKLVYKIIGYRGEC